MILWLRRTLRYAVLVLVGLATFWRRPPPGRGACDEDGVPIGELDGAMAPAADVVREVEGEPDPGPR